MNVPEFLKVLGKNNIYFGFLKSIMPGNISNFNTLDTIRCFYLLKVQKSRQQLTEVLGVGEGSTRAILDILKGMDLIVSTQKGHVHSKKGEKLLLELDKNVTFPILIDDNSFIKKHFQHYSKDAAVAGQIYLKQSWNKPYILRDHAIKVGGDGVLFLEIQDGKIFCQEYKSGMGIKDYFNLNRESKILVIVGANRIVAERGLLNILLHETKIFDSFKA